MKKLRHNLTSGYLNAAAYLSPRRQRRRIVAYVESYDDIAFWRTLLSEFETDRYYFQVMLPSQRTLAKGKKMVLTNLLKVEQLGSSLIACVDSDYDFLLQGTTELSREINGSPYVLQTYAYAIENFQCYAPSLHQVCVLATLNDRPLINFEAFMEHYSCVVYPLFLWNIWFYRHRDLKTFPMYDLNECIRLTDVNLREPQRALQRLERTVNERLKRMERQHAGDVDQVKRLGEELLRLGLKPETTYLYLQGHHVMENVVLKLLTPVCTQLRREREQEIKRLAGHATQLQNELTCYENSIASVAVMLRKNDAYKSLYLYQWMREEVEEFLQRFFPAGPNDDTTEAKRTYKTENDDHRKSGK